ncbi:endolytic transglycosylase MltG [Microbacterium esteraromaticum]|uniref:Endolytic murein transglycosylase n=1 Tax=Microbacterium esteraromaticum TaxID=57043 RepID=A0A7D8ADI6_9MICO|nr:endolytic transglycosylase MltG [Microbacterium esteraromaticum]QMU98181.1 endolytic transglycosylase MltG [Microbacterium esteraromaticum]
MSDPHDRTSDSLGDFFDNVPTASTPLPERESRDEPAPGSRRALREAAAREATGREPAQHGTGVTGSPADDHAARSPLAAEPAAEPEPSAGASVTPPVDTSLTAEAPDEPDHGSFEGLFAPEAATEVPRRRRGRGCLIALLVLLVIGGGITAAGAWVWSQHGDKISDVMGWGEPKDYEAGIATGEAFVTIKQGDTGSPVSTALFEAKVTKTDRVFYDYLIENEPNVTFYPGVYKLQQKMTAAAALKALENPENRMANTVRIAEGSTVESSLPRIAEGVGIPMEELEAAVKDPAAYDVDAPSLEGWLFPAIYTFDPGASATDVIAAMVDRTRKSLTDAGVPDADAQRVLTIASIIEREARTADFPKVSRVIENRIADGMMLQMDSTAQYGYGELHAGKASTSEEAQHNDNPWNTYVITGLPATPIANSGDAAITAAMHPADGPWLYFVTIDFATGETQFSETYEEHQQGIKKMRAWCSANPDYKGC